MSDNKIVIEIDGQNLEDYESGSVSLQLDQFCNSFSFTTAKSLQGEYNIFPEAECRIFINDKLALTGVIDSVSPSEDASSSKVDVSGRDRTCDIVDSCLPESISLSGEFTLQTVIEKVVASLGLQGIEVINELGEDLKKFTSADIVSAEVDKNAFEFINEYAQKASVLLITDEGGNIVITRAGENRYIDKLLNDVGNPDNNILSSSAGYDYSQRYYKYIVVSQSNTNTQKSDVKLENMAQKGIAIDDEIRESRVLVIKANNACDSATCKEIATLEANVRRANSLKYSCTVYGFETNDGELWHRNHLIQVYDIDNDIDSELLIKGLTFNIGNDGATTDIELALADAYTLQASLDEVNGRTNKTKKSDKKKKGKGGKKKSDKSLSDKEIDQILGF